MHPFRITRWQVGENGEKTLKTHIVLAFVPGKGFLVADPDIKEEDGKKISGALDYFAVFNMKLWHFAGLEK